MRKLPLADVDVLVELVNKLDPYFRRPYEWGAYATMFRTLDPKTHAWINSRADPLASIRLLERAVKAFPEDYK